MYEADFCRSDYQKLLICSLNKRSGRAFVSRHAVEPLKAQLSFWNTRPSFWGLKRQLKARPRVWKARLSAWKARPLVCVITRPMLSQSTTVQYTIFFRPGFPVVEQKWFLSVFDNNLVASWYVNVLFCKEVAEVFWLKDKILLYRIEQICKGAFHQY